MCEDGVEIEVSRTDATMLKKTTNPSDLGGPSFYLTMPSDWKKLPTKAQHTVAPALLQMFADFPQTLQQLAKNQRFEPLAKLLVVAAAGSCVLEVHLSEYVTPTAALTFRVDGAKFSITGPQDIEHEMSIPTPLRDVHRSVGGIYLEYMVSGSLMSPAGVLSLNEFRAQFGNLFDIPKRLPPAVAFYEVDGDYLFCTKAGATFWLGSEHYTGKPGAAGKSVDAVLTEMLKQFRQGKKYHAP